MSKTSTDQLSIWHEHVCGCSHTTTCIVIYHRCIIKNQIYHSLRYPKRQSTISYFVQYNDDCYDTLFGSIEVFFKYKGSTFALIHNYPNRNLFSNTFSSSYHSFLSRCINKYFYIFQPKSSSFHYVSMEKILNLCIVFEKDQFLIATPISQVFEHD